MPEMKCEGLSSLALLAALSTSCLLQYSHLLTLSSVGFRLEDSEVRGACHPELLPVPALEAKSQHCAGVGHCGTLK